MDDDGIWGATSERLYLDLAREYPEMTKRVMGQDHLDIEPQFMGFCLTYRLLAMLIPKDWTVVDFGCCSAAQSYYFRNHAKYIGVDEEPMERFSFANSEIHACSIAEYIARGGEMTKRFAICNYVPSRETDLVRQTYKNVYVFYPEGTDLLDEIGAAIVQRMRTKGLVQ